MKTLSSMWKQSVAGAVLVAALSAGPEVASADDGERERPAEKRVEREGDREEGRRQEGEGRKREGEEGRERPRGEGARDEREVYRAKLLERIEGLERLKKLAVKAKDEKAVAFVEKLLGETREKLGKLTKEIESRREPEKGERDRKEERKREGEGEWREVDGHRVRRGEGDREKGEGEGREERGREGDSVRRRWWEPSDKK